ncbi:MAG: pilus assembly protein TadG-related protein, partial [Thermomicrobiales bacterium]
MALFAIGFSVLMSFAALTVDFSNVYLNRRLLQNSVDAAVLAAAPELPGSPSNARTYACDYGSTAPKNLVPGMFGKNGDCSGKLDVAVTTSSVANDTIRVTAYKTIHPMFGSIVGWKDFEVSATAKAVVGSAAESCPFPVFLTEDILPPGTYPDKVQFFGLVKIVFKGDAIDVGNGANGVEEGMYG